MASSSSNNKLEAGWVFGTRVEALCTHRLQAGEVLQHMASLFLSLTGWLPPHHIALDGNRTALCQTVVPEELWCKV